MIVEVELRLLKVSKPLCSVVGQQYSYSAVSGSACLEEINAMMEDELMARLGETVGARLASDSAVWVFTFQLCQVRASWVSNL